MDKIIIKQAKFFCNLGITKEERKKKQEIILDIELFFDIKKAGKTDDINDTINYSEVHSNIKDLIEKKEYNLIETIAEDIATKILGNFPIDKILVRVKKHGAMSKKNVSYTAVEIVRKKNE